MKEKILGAVAVGLIEVAILTLCSTSGCLFAHCIEMKIQENLAKKNQKKANGTN